MFVFGGKGGCMMVFMKIDTFKKLLLVWWVFSRFVSILFKNDYKCNYFLLKKGVIGTFGRWVKMYRICIHAFSKYISKNLHQVALLHTTDFLIARDLKD